MENFNLYIEQFDYSSIINLFKGKGELRILKKKEYFVRQNEASQFVAWVYCGMFHYTCINDDGSQHIVGYSFDNEFIGDFASQSHHNISTVNIQAMTNAEIYVLPYNILNQFWETDMNTQRLGRQIAEKMFSEIYHRLLGFYCDTPEQRYVKLMQRCPRLKEKVSLQNIASFLNVTPETVSHIRRKLRQK